MTKQLAKLKTISRFNDLNGLDEANKGNKTAAAAAINAKRGRERHVIAVR